MSTHTESVREIRFSWRHDCPFNHLTEEFPSLDIRWETPAVGVDEQTVLGRFMVEPADPDAATTVREELQRYPSIRRVEQTTDRLFTCVLDREMITMPPELLCECLSVSIHEHDGIEEWRVLTPSARVERFLFDTLNNDADATFDLKRKVALEEFGADARTLRDELTEKQQEAIVAGMAQGYFEYPRESTADEVAADLGISASSFTSRIRRGQRKLVESVFAN